jgi:CRISPR-associated endonuclease/helicase Cas3
LFAELDLDKHKVQQERAALNYPEVASRYHLIADDTVPVVVPYGYAEERLAAWLREPTRHTWQRLQPYLVSVFRRDVARLQGSGLLHAETERLFRWLGSYHQRLGLQEVLADPSDLIV